jgi:hypothetical protein
MAAGVEEFAEAKPGFADRIRIGHTKAIEAERFCLTRERGLDL